MIRKFRVTVASFVASYLPAHLRKPNRIALFAALLEPFRVLDAAFVAFRDRGIIAARTTGETASLEWYLNYLYDPTQKRIQLATAPSAGVLAGVEATEPSRYQVAGLPSEISFVAGLPSETAVFGAADFVVRRPFTLAAQDAGITKTTNSYRAAGKLFKIVDL